MQAVVEKRETDNTGREPEGGGMKWRERAEVGLIETRTIGSIFMARVYNDRLAIWRQDGNRLTWEEVQEVKQMIWGNLVAVEVYPAEPDVINERHTRHVWTSRAIRDVVNEECAHPEFRLVPTLNDAIQGGE